MPLPVTALAAVFDASLVAVVAARLWRARHRGASLRMRLFAALAASVLLGALATGLYAVAEDGSSLGFGPRLLSVAPKAFVLGSVLLAVAAAGAALAGRRLARSVERLADVAARIAEGERTACLPAAGEGEARRITRALASLRREVESRPYAAAFLRDAWHDLKTPLAAIRATVELLEDGALEDPRAARRFVGNVARSAAELDRMLADLVLLARMETSALAAERTTQVSTLITGAIDRVAPLATARGVALEREVPPGLPWDRTLRCDAAALERALGNLLENAVDATPGGRVSVSFAGSARDAITVDVVNEPASVPRGMRASLFQRAATSGKPMGTGLGLAIARAAVEAHGGRLSFIEMGPPRVRVRVELPR
ncbi:MAG TPA: ATP-binding protein [Polyangiaceae bacterium]|jgi:signal transduction histidine kinase